jgi:hypothetical protein
MHVGRDRDMADRIFVSIEAVTHAASSRRHQVAA